MKSRRLLPKFAGAGNGSERTGNGQRQMSSSSALSQSDFNLASRKFSYDDINSRASPPSKRYRVPIGKQRQNGQHSRVSTHIRSDVEDNLDDQELFDERNETSIATNRSVTKKKLGDTNLAGTSSFVVEDLYQSDMNQDGQNTRIEPFQTDFSSSTTRNSAKRNAADRLLTRSIRNAIAAEMAYTKSLYRQRHPLALKQTKSSTSAVRRSNSHRSYDQMYEDRLTATGGKNQVHQNLKHASTSQNGLGKIEKTATYIVDDVMEKALETIYGKRRLGLTSKTNAAGKNLSTTTAGDWTSVADDADFRNVANDESTYDRAVRSSIENRVRGTLHSSSPVFKRSDGRRRSSSTPRLTSATDFRGIERRQVDKRNASSDYYLSPVQTQPRAYQQRTTNNNRHVMTAKQMRNYASDTALFLPLPHLSLKTGNHSAWHNASTDSEFSTTLELRKPQPQQLQHYTMTEMGINSLDRPTERQRYSRPVTLTKGMVTKVVHGLQSDEVTCSGLPSRDESRVSSQQSMATGTQVSTGVGGHRVTSPPPGLNVLSVPTVYTGIRPQQTAGLRHWDIDDTDRQLSSTTSTLSSAKAHFSAGNTSTFVSPSETPSVRVQRATDSRVDLLIDPAKQRQHPKVRTYNLAATGSSNGGTPIGLPAISEYSLEKQMVSSPAYAAYSNEPMIVADLMNRCEPEMEFNQRQRLKMRRAASLGDLLSPSNAALSVTDEGPSRASIYSSGTPNISMSNGQVLNLYMFGRPRSNETPVRRRSLERTLELETLTRSMAFDEDKLFKHDRQTSPLPVRCVIDEKQTQTSSYRSPELTPKMKVQVATGRDIGTSAATPTSNIAVQTERNVDRKSTPIKVERLVPTTFAYSSSAGQKSSGTKDKEPVQSRASNVIQQTYFVPPSIVETRETEMTGDVFADNRLTRYRVNDDSRRIVPVAEAPVVEQRKPETDNFMQFDQFFTRESRSERPDGELAAQNEGKEAEEDDDDEEVLLETIVVEEREQRIEMTIREDIEFSLQRTQGFGRLGDSGEVDTSSGDRCARIEPWWIPPRYEAYVERKKQKITQISEVENKDDYTKKVDHENDQSTILETDSSGRYNRAQSQSGIGAELKPYEIKRNTDSQRSLPENDVEIPVKVDEVYVPPLLQAIDRGVRSSRGIGRYERTSSTEPRTTERDTTIASDSCTMRADLDYPPVTSSRDSSSSFVIWKPNLNTQQHKPITSIRTVTSKTNDQRPDEVVSTSTAPTSYRVFPRSKIALPVVPDSKVTSSFMFHGTKAKSIEDDGDLLPDSLDHLDKIVSHLEEEILVTQNTDTSRVGSKQSYKNSNGGSGNTRQALSEYPTSGNGGSGNTQQALSEYPTSLRTKCESTSSVKNNAKPLPPKPLKKSWKVEAFKAKTQLKPDKQQQQQQPPLQLEPPEEPYKQECSRTAVESGDTNCFGKTPHFIQELPERNFATINLMDHHTSRQPSEGSDCNNNSSGLMKLMSEHVSSLPSTQGLNQNIRKSLESRKEVMVGTGRMPLSNNNGDWSGTGRLDANGFETMITAL